MKFWKFEAAGNDFVLLEKKPGPKLNVEVKNLCQKHTGIGSDGLIYCWLQGAKWRWRFFNADGSETKLCGNATRAVAEFLSLKKVKKLEWLGSLGLFRARKNKARRWEVTWPQAEPEERKLPEPVMESILQLNERGLAAAYWFHVGVPHVVLLSFEEWNMEDRQVFGPELRRHSLLGAEGANVTWLNLKNLHCVTFERGVEAETLACGSGAIAAFLALRTYQASRSEKLSSSVQLRFPGGDLGVQFVQNEIWLAGPCQLVFEGRLVKKDFKKL